MSTLFKNSGNTTNLKAHLNLNHPICFPHWEQKPQLERGLCKKTYISQTAIPALYNKVKSDILKEIKDVSFYSAITDMWSSSNMTPYMSLTIHYRTAALTPAVKVLRDQIHSADTPAEALQSALADWALDECKMVCTCSIALATISIWLCPTVWTVMGLCISFQHPDKAERPKEDTE